MLPLNDPLADPLADSLAVALVPKFNLGTRAYL